MPNVSEQISQILLKKLREEALTPQEAAILAEWEGRSPEHAEFIVLLMDEASLSDKIKGMLELDERAAWQRIERALEAEWNERSVPSKRKIAWYKYAATASVMLILGFGIYYFVISRSAVSETSNAVKPAAITAFAPGGNRAELTLADGSVIDLDKAQNGTLAKEGGSNVVKMGDGRLAYEGEVGSHLANVPKNTLKTPRGGQYRLDLPDGSKVWLNAASSLTYPVVFANDERRVEINGEAYFEVAKDESREFHVVIKNADGESKAEITVLGTHFNVQAYDDEKTLAASLVEGKIKIAARAERNVSNSKTLVPGQQAQITADNKLKIVEDVDMDHVTAWKNGIISFSSADVQTIMRAIGRWYNVEVVFEGNIESKTGLTGGAARNTSLPKLIEVLRFNDLNCSLENGKLVVRPFNIPSNPNP